MPWLNTRRDKTHQNIATGLSHIKCVIYTFNLFGVKISKRGCALLFQIFGSFRCLLENQLLSSTRKNVCWQPFNSRKSDSNVTHSGISAWPAENGHKSHWLEIVYISPEKNLTAMVFHTAEWTKRSHPRLLLIQNSRLWRKNSASLFSCDKKPTQTTPQNAINEYLFFSHHQARLHTQEWGELWINSCHAVHCSPDRLLSIRMKS